MNDAVTIGAQINGVRCSTCSSADLIAIAPGREGEYAISVIATKRGTPMRAWCINCWPALHAPEARTGASA